MTEMGEIHNNRSRRACRTRSMSRPTSPSSRATRELVSAQIIPLLAFLAK